MTKPRVGQLVYIKWVDSHYGSGWTRGSVQEASLLCHSVGWLFHADKDGTTIASHITVEDDPQREAEMTIPTCAIKRIVVLQEP